MGDGSGSRCSPARPPIHKRAPLIRAGLSATRPLVYQHPIMLDIQTFDARRGGNVLYKALVHPLAADAIAEPGGRNTPEQGALGVFDPDGVAVALFALHPEMPAPAEFYVQDVDALDNTLCRRDRAPADRSAALCLPRVADRQLRFGADQSSASPISVPLGVRVVSLDRARLPAPPADGARTYLDKLNFATNYALFQGRRWPSPRAWSAPITGRAMGRRAVTLLAVPVRRHRAKCWRRGSRRCPKARAGMPSTAARCARVSAWGRLPASSFLHAVGVAGHDVVKYALDFFSTSAEGADHALAVTHDANAWPSDRYAGLPAPRDGEQVLLWVQNSHAAPIPAGAVTLNRMGQNEARAARAGDRPFRQSWRWMCRQAAAGGGVAGADRNAHRPPCGAATL